MWSYPPSRILVPVDFGDASGRAVVVAAALARTFGSRIRALHAEALEAPPYFTHAQVSAIERQRIAARAAAEGYLLRFVERLAGVPTSAGLIDGPPEAGIIEAARDEDIVVMGTHGRKGPSLWWLGSVAERVVRGSSVPVLVVRAGGEHAAPPEEVFARPLVVLGTDVFEGEAMRYASGLAEAFGGSLPPAAPACDVTLAVQREATLMVVPMRTGTSHWFGEATERLLRGCALPMLFVPSAQQSAP